MLLNKELRDKLNQSRILTMSNNRKCDYLIVDCGRSNSTMVMGVIDNNTSDIVFIKELFSNKIDEIISDVENICYEFDINRVLTDINGIGLGFYERFSELISDIRIEGVKKFSYDYITYFLKDINDYNIRLMQSAECADNSYKKSFLGYSEIINIHKETDKLFKELDNLDFKVEDSKIKLIRLDEGISNLRFNCLMIYYGYKYNKEKENVVVNKIDKTKEMEIQRRMANYKIAQGMLYKYMFKAIDAEKLSIIFYHNNWGQTEKFKNMIREEEFKELFNKEIENLIIARDRIEIYFLNGSKIQFRYASDNARGYKYHYAVVDTNISREMFDNVIRHTSIPYYKQDGKIQELEDTWRIEFMEF